MKTDFSINVQVHLGLAPELSELVNSILSYLPSVATGTASLVSSEAEPASASPEQPTDDEPAKSKEQEAPVTPVVQKTLTAEDVRKAMHRTRQRIEGEDYKENTDSEAYKKYHKALTMQFKNLASIMGADKPSALPSDKIGSFIEQCDELQVLDDGTIGSNDPF